MSNLVFLWSVDSKKTNSVLIYISYLICIVNYEREI